jgi:hypothetical protein
MMAALNIGVLANQLRKAGEDAAAAASADSAASGGGAGPSTSARGARRQASPPPEFHMGLRERKPVDYEEKRLANERPRRALSFDPLPPRVIPMPVLVDRSRRTAAGTSAAGSSSAAATVPRRKPFGDWNLEFLTLCAFMAAHPQRAIDALRRLVRDPLGPNANRARAFVRDPNPSRARTNANLLRVAARRSHSCISPPRDAHADPLPRPRRRRSGCGRTGRSSSSIR